MKRKQFTSAVLVGLIVLAGVGITAMAAPSLDTSTTDETANQTGLDPTAQLVDFSQFHAANNSTFTFQFNATGLDASNDTEAKILQERGGTNYTIETYSSPTKVHNSYNGTGSKDYAHFNVTVNYEDMAEAERYKDEQFNVTLRFDENVSASGGSSLGNWTVTVVANGSGHPASVEPVEGQESDETITNHEAETLIFNLTNPLSDDYSEASAKGNVTNGSKAVFIVSNSSMADDFDRSVSGLDTKEQAPKSLVRVSDANGDTTKVVPVYANKAPSTASGTYAIYNQSYFGLNALEVHVGDDFSSASHIEIEAFGAADFLTRLKEFGFGPTVDHLNIPFLGQFGTPLPVAGG